MTGTQKAEYPPSIEVDGEHAPPLFLRAVDETFPSPATNPGISEARVNPSKLRKGCSERGFNCLAVADVAQSRIDRAAMGTQPRGRARLLLGIAAPDRNGTASPRKRVSHAEPNPAVAARVIATRPVRSKSPTDVPPIFQSLRSQRSRAFGCAQRRGSRPRIRSKPCFIAAKRSSISGSNSLSVKM